MNEVLENFSLMCLPKHEFQSATNHHKNLIWAQTRSKFQSNGPFEMDLFWSIKIWWFDILKKPWKSVLPEKYRRFTEFQRDSFNFTNIKFSTQKYETIENLNLKEINKVSSRLIWLALTRNTARFFALCIWSKYPLILIGTCI